MIIALPYENEEVFQHFGKSENFVFYTIENKKVLDKKVVNTNGQGHGALVGFLEENKANVLICGGIGQGAIEFLSQTGIEVFADNIGKCDELVNQYLEGKLLKNDDVCCCHSDSDGSGEHHCH